MKLFYSITTLLLLTACSKHKGDFVPEEDSIPAASLVFSQPDAGASFRNGDTVRIMAQAISSETIHGFDVAIRKAGDTTLIWSTHIHDHNDTLHIAQFWVNDRTSAQSLEAVITLELDHEGHTLTKSAPFRVQ
jgi:hypothetical protein